MKGEECESYLAHVVQRQKHTFEAGSRTKERERKAVLNGDKRRVLGGAPLVYQAGTSVFTASMLIAQAEQKMILIGPLGPRRRNSRTRARE